MTRDKFYNTPFSMYPLRPVLSGTIWVYQGEDAPYLSYLTTSGVLGSLQLDGSVLPMSSGRANYSTPVDFGNISKYKGVTEDKLSSMYSKVLKRLDYNRRILSSEETTAAVYVLLTLEHHLYGGGMDMNEYMRKHVYPEIPVSWISAQDSVPLTPNPNSYTNSMGIEFERTIKIRWDNV